MKIILSFLCFSFIALSALKAQAVGGLDFSFDSDGRVTYLSDKEEIAYAMAVQPDGKILVGGRIDIAASICHFILIRYNTDGTLDSNFGTNGVVETTLHGTEDVINAIALQPDGKIVVAGTSWSDITAYDIAFARYNTNGTLDNTFGNNGIKLIDIRGTDDKINSALVIQPDGKILVGGDFSTYKGVTANRIIRLVIIMPSSCPTTLRKPRRSPLVKLPQRSKKKRKTKSSFPIRFLPATGQPIALWPRPSPPICLVS